MNNGYADVREKIEARIVKEGLDNVSEKDLLQLLYVQLRSMELANKRAFSVNLDWKGAAAAALAILTALGTISATAATAAQKILGG